MKRGKKTLSAAAGGLAVGLFNGLFGSGGGLLAVGLLKKLGLDQKRAHSNAVAVILPLSAVSAALYLAAGQMRLADALPYLPGGVVGSLVGARLLKRLPANLLRRIFGVFLLWAGVRLWTR